MSIAEFREPSELAGGLLVGKPPVGLPVAAVRPAKRPGAPRLRARLLVLDSVALTAAWLPAVVVGSPASATVLVATVVVAVGASLAAMVVLGLYRSRQCAVRRLELRGVARSAVVGGLTALGVTDLAAARMPVGRLAVGAWLAWAITSIARGAFGAWLRAGRARGRFSRPVAIVGADDEAAQLNRLFADHPEYGYDVRGVVGPREQVRRSGIPAPWLGDYGDLVDLVASHQLTGVVVVLGAVPPETRRPAIDALLGAGVHVQLSSGISGFDHRRIRPVPVGHEPLYYLEGPSRRADPNQPLRRVVDVVVAAVSLVVTSPIMLVAGLAVKLGDRGPILFRQERIGRDGKPFTILKFRSMAQDAPERLAEVRSLNRRHEANPLFQAGDSDPRTTPVGRFLRATSIDELPQLVNVLAGNMAMVGPRPALPHEVAQFDAELLGRHAVRPGITGLWQVEARDNPSYHAYRRLDLFYVENWSWSLDLYVLVSTMWSLVARTAVTCWRMGRRVMVARRAPRELSLGTEKIGEIAHESS